MKGFFVDFTYNTGLVMLSIAVAMLGSFTGLVMTTGIRDAGSSEVKLRIVLGALGIGGGIWSMHFISMLAVMLPIHLSYDVAETAASAVIAIIFTAMALAIVSSRKFGSATLPVSALFLGCGIGGMHYLGMHAIRGGCTLLYSWVGVGISVAIAIHASSVALWFAFRQRGVLDTFLGAMVLGLAIASMHYSGMEATSFLPTSSPMEELKMVLLENYLALAIAVTQYAVCGTCLIVFAILVFRPSASHRPSAKLLPEFNTLSEHLRRDRIESRQLYHPDLPEQFENDWAMPVSDLAFIERRLDGFDQNRRGVTVELKNSCKSTSTRH
jgi:NO-binding membrane sensor protein with MHYT domain